MKKIFVTVAEFLENGGELKDGRQTYRENGQPYIKFHSKETDYIKNSISNSTYVEIYCQPIYV